MVAIPADFVADVRDALSVSNSYDVRIERGVRQTLTKLLRDYNFPKSVVTLLMAPTTSRSFALPVSFKRPVFAQLLDVSVTPTTYLELHRSDTFRLPQPSGAPHYYWLEGMSLVVDTAILDPNIRLNLFYQSLDVDAAIPWFFAEFPDVLRSYAVYRLAGDMRKADVASLYQGYSQDDLQSIAVYLNELEWSKVEYDWRERAAPPLPRYGR